MTDLLAGKYELYRITSERLRQVLDYDPLTGVFHWKMRCGGKAVAGSIAGSIDRNGYRVIRIDRRIYQSHRLAWFYFHGVWPIKGIDHVNRVKTDNRIENLRQAEHCQNQMNKLAYRTNTSGFKGVHFQAGKWAAEIQVRGERIYLGRFQTPEEASVVYEHAAREHFGEFAPQ